MVEFRDAASAVNLPDMLNIIPVSELTAGKFAVPEEISCPICHDRFASENSKTEHLERTHPTWAETLMFAYLRKTPRENG